jgi:hypothetical protein
MPADRLPTLLEVDPQPDAIGFLVRSFAASGARYRLRRLGSVGALDLHLDGWLEPVLSARAWEAPGSARFRDQCARALTGCASPRLLCVRGAPLDPALLKSFAPDIVIAEEAAMPRGLRIIRPLDGITLAVGVVSEAAELQWIELWAAHAAKIAARRTMTRLALPADTLSVWDGVGESAFDGWTPMLRLGADRPMRLIVPMIGRRGVRIKLRLSEGWSGGLLANLNGVPLPLHTNGDFRQGEGVCTAVGRDALLSLHIDPGTDRAIADAGVMLRQIDLEAA